MPMQWRGEGVRGLGHCQCGRTLPRILPARRWASFRVEQGCKGARWLRAEPTLPPPTPWELAGGTHSPASPSPASCCAFLVVEDKINNPNWRLWLTALGEQWGGDSWGAACAAVN